MSDRKEFYEGNALLAVFDGIEISGQDKDFGPMYRIPNYYPFCKMDDPDNSGWTD